MLCDNVYKFSYTEMPPHKVSASKRKAGASASKPRPRKASGNKRKVSAIASKKIFSVIQASPLKRCARSSDRQVPGTPLRTLVSKSAAAVMTDEASGQCGPALLSHRGEPRVGQHNCCAVR